MMQDEFLASYLNDPALQAKYGDYGTYRNFMMGQAQGDNTGIAPVYNNLVSNNQVPLEATAKNFIKNKIVNKLNLPKIGNIPIIGPGSLALGIATQVLPPEDPVTAASRSYFEGLYGTDDIGRIQEGDLMAGYNPISGGLLYDLTGGKFGKERTIGLDKAYDKRIKTIKEKGIPRLLKAGKDTSNLLSRLKILEDRKAADAKALSQIKSSGGKAPVSVKKTGGGDGGGSPAQMSKAKAASVAASNKASQERGKALHGGM